MNVTFKCLHCSQPMTVSDISKSDGICDNCNPFDPSCGAKSAMSESPQRLRAALESIWQYGADTLSGRTDGPDDRAWQRDAVREMTMRTRDGLEATQAAKQAEPVAMVRHVTYEGIARNGIAQEIVMLDGAPMLPDGSYLYATPQPAAPAQELSDEQIRAIFLANGFTVKEGQSDLKPYVFAAARALLAAARAQSQEPPGGAVGTASTTLSAG
jgi:hypothetical protein